MRFPQAVGIEPDRRMVKPAGIGIPQPPGLVGLIESHFVHVAGLADIVMTQVVVHTIVGRSCTVDDHVCRLRVAGTEPAQRVRHPHLRHLLDFRNHLRAIARGHASGAGDRKWCRQRQTEQTPACAHGTGAAVLLGAAVDRFLQSQRELQPRTGCRNRQQPGHGDAAQPGEQVELGNPHQKILTPGFPVRTEQHARIIDRVLMKAVDQRLEKVAAIDLQG